MSRRIALFASIAGVLALAPGAARASCTIPGLGVMNFGTYDPFSTTPLDIASVGSVNCTSPTTIDVSAGSSGTYANRTLRSGAQVLNYNVYLDAARTNVLGTTTYNVPPGNVPVTLYGRIPAGQDVAVGSYADTLVVTFTF